MGRRKMICLCEIFYSDNKAKLPLLTWKKFKASIFQNFAKREKDRFNQKILDKKNIAGGYDEVSIEVAKLYEGSPSIDT